MKKFNRAIVRTPCKALTQGITSAPELGKPVFEQALKQHKAYIQALEQCGVTVSILDAAEQYPDSCFIEDVAVLTEKCAIITNPGAPSRNGEKDLAVEEISKYYKADTMHHILSPGTLDGGDVMMVGDTFYVGESARTNAEGIRQFSDILSQYGYRCIPVDLKEVLHLKTGVNYLEHNHLLVSGEFVDNPLFDSFHKIVIPENEAYAANCIWVNDTIIVPEGYPKVLAKIKELGYPTICVDVSEFRKLDGGLSCLSLRF